MIRYINMRSEATGDVVSIFDREREVVIPISTSNTDYCNYLDWVALGNFADEPEGYDYGN